MAILWLADVLRAAGVQVIEEGNWQARGVGGSFNPIGVLWHHTASATSSPSRPAPGLSVVINGRSDLPGPLAHALVDYNGVFHVISANRCNHAGATRVSGPIPQSSSGNGFLIGWEIDYNGVSQQMSPMQYQASLKATAAVLRQLGRDASYVRGHRETSITGKIDPYAVNLDTMRAEVAGLIAGGGGVAGQAYTYRDQQHVAAVGTGGGLTNLSWSPATGVVRPDWGGGTLVGKPVGYVHDDLQHVFARGNDNTLRYYAQGASGSPTVEDWGAVGRVASNPAGFAYGAQRHVFYRNPDGNLEHRFWDRNSNQVTTGVWAGGPFVGNPFAFVHRDQQHIFARDAAGGLKHWYWWPGIDPGVDNWGVTAGVASDVTGFSFGAQHHVFYRDTAGQLQHRFVDDASPTVVGDVWGGGPFVGTPHAISHRGQQHVFGRKANGDLMHCFWSPTIDPPANDTWGAAGVVADDPVGLSTPDAHHVFYRTADGSLEHRFFVDAAGSLVTDTWGGSLAPS